MNYTRKVIFILDFLISPTVTLRNIVFEKMFALVLEEDWEIWFWRMVSILTLVVFRMT